MPPAVTTLLRLLLSLLLFSPSPLVLGASEKKAKPVAPEPAPVRMAFKPDAAGFGQQVQPFLKEHCVSCHCAEKQKGDLRLDTQPNRFEDAATAARWAEVVHVLNRHEMPPEEKPQPAPAAASRFAEWLEGELSRAELSKRTFRVVLRRMNRAEYNNTIRDLIGVDFHPSDSFPEDPPAGGFDNIGRALSVSPLQLELYYAAARRILDRALVEGERPPPIKWRFEPEDNTLGTDRFRVQRDTQKAILLNKGENPVEGGLTVIHHNAWNKVPSFRNFSVPAEGEYIVRFRAAGRVPEREAVVGSARGILEARRAEADAKNPQFKERNEKHMQDDLRHFETHPCYGYGPPRVKLTQHLGGSPKVLAEMDVAAPEGAPQDYEVRAHFTTQSAGINVQYDYAIPKMLENSWMQWRDEFARPVLLLDWLELEGPVQAAWPPESHTRLLFDSPNRGLSEKAYATEVLARFMARAYRRPVRPEEVASKVALFESLRSEKPSFVEAIKVPLAAVLTSPQFLYLVEPVPEDAAPRKLDPYELASRLSYFLWSSLPDAELSRAAATGALLQPEGMRAHLRRMLADPRSEALVKNFAGQWLGLRKMGANPPSATLYPEYDRHLEVSMVRETEAFFAEILHHRLDVRTLLKSDFVTINERLARFYRIPGSRATRCAEWRCLPRCTAAGW